VARRQGAHEHEPTRGEVGAAISIASGSQSRHDCCTLHVIMGCIPLRKVDEGVASAHPSDLRICARVMAGDRLQGIKMPLRGLYMYSQLFLL
jgi:hypothetical protein